MRSICKKSSATLVAVLALCALAAASASAAQLYVGGKALTGTAKLATTVKVEQPVVFSVTKEELKVVITCTKASLEKETKLEAPGKLTSGYVGFEGCTEKGEEGCTISERIGFNPIEGSLATGTAPEDAILFTQKKNNFTNLEFFGSCFLSGEFSGLMGKLPLKLAKGQTESTEQEFVGEGSTGTGFEFRGVGTPAPPVYVTGKLKLKLESGSAWSYH
jgi:hypothetical protein